MQESNNLLKSGYSLEILDNGVQVLQKEGLYKFTSDAVLLSRFAPFKKGEVVADFCSGSGVVGFNYFALNGGVSSMHFFELQQPLFELSQKSIQLNGFKNFFAINCDAQNIPKEFNNYFSLVLCNPPYERGCAGFNKEDNSIALCHKELALDLGSLIKSIARSLKFGGKLCMVHRADRLADIIYEMRLNKIQPKRLKFIFGKQSSPYGVLIEGVLGGKSGLKIEPPENN